MRQLLRIFGLMLIVVSSLTAQAGEIAWRTSLAQAKREAKAQNKLIMVDLYTDWCGFCKKLDRETYTDAGVLKLTAAKFVPLKLNPEKQPDAAQLAKKARVQGFPTILFINADGEIYHRIGGYAPAQPFMEEMNQALEVQRLLPTLQAKVRANPNDARSLFELTGVYAKIGRVEAVKSLFPRAESLTKGSNRDSVRMAVALMYSEQRNAKAALPIFQRVASSGMDSNTRAYALFSAGICHYQLGDKRAAAQSLRSAQATPGIPDSFKQRITQMLDSI